MASLFFFFCISFSHIFSPAGVGLDYFSIRYCGLRRSFVYRATSATALAITLETECISIGSNLANTSSE